MGLAELQAIRANRDKPKEKKIYKIPKVSKKRKAKLNEQAKAGDTKMDDFFTAMRKNMTGTCQCGCGEKSQKNDDTFFRNCICHIFPKRIFKSIATHPLNWVERTFWGGHHTNMDDRSIELWKNYADFDDIKEKFHELAPLLTDEERSNKFYHNLEKIIYNNN